MTAQDPASLSCTSLMSQALSDSASRKFYSCLRENQSLLEDFAHAVKEESIAGTKNYTWASMVEMAALANVLNRRV